MGVDVVVVVVVVDSPGRFPHGSQALGGAVVVVVVVGVGVDDSPGGC